MQLLPAAGPGAAKTNQPVERLHEIRENPGAILRRRRETETPRKSSEALGQSRIRLARVKEDFEGRSVGRRLEVDHWFCTKKESPV